MDFKKFCDNSPSAQNAIDIFSGHWASRLPRHPEGLGAGVAAHFDDDPRPFFAARAFGDVFKRLDGFQICELGPMEAGHTYQLELLGAHVSAIEGNVEAFLKCLIVKEIFGLKAKFYLGNFVRYLAESQKNYDMVFASGVLYHMIEPLKLIDAICRRSPRCFLWTHYFDPQVCEGYVECDAQYGGMRVPHYQKGYGDRSHGRFWGGLGDTASWLRRQDIIDALHKFGHSNVEIVDEQFDHPNGPCFSIVSHA